MRIHKTLALFALGFGCAIYLAAGAPSAQQHSYTQQEIDAGRALYDGNCGRCHNDDGAGVTGIELFRQIRRLNEHLSARGLHRASEWLDAAQDWLHARRILRYPRDLRRIQDAVYALHLARPASAFDPGALPARKAAVDLTALSGLHEVAQRCRVLHGWISRRAAE